jgi:starch synthase
VGGLLDSVTDASADALHGTGFVMTGCDAEGLEDALARALRLWREPKNWRRLQANGMARHFGWEDSALQYLEVYERALLEARAGGKAGTPSAAPR